MISVGSTLMVAPNLEVWDILDFGAKGTLQNVALLFMSTGGTAGLVSSKRLTPSSSEHLGSGSGCIFGPIAKARARFAACRPNLLAAVVDHERIKISTATDSLVDK